MRPVLVALVEVSVYWTYKVGVNDKDCGNFECSAPSVHLP